MGKFELETLQLYFPCSMELQEELIKNKYRVPIETPIPIIYGNFKGYDPSYESEGVKKAAIIHPSRYGKTLEELGWGDNDKFFSLPKEKGTYLKIDLEETKDKKLLHFTVEFTDEKPNYHLEKISYRASQPRIWSNWAMFYIEYEDLDVLLEKLMKKVDLPSKYCELPYYIKHEVQQNGLEDTYYICSNKYNYDRRFGIQIESYTLCPGCFDHVLDYFNNESRTKGGNSIKDVKLRLISDDVPIFAKIGLSKMENKHPQFMFKIVANPDIKKRIKKLDGKEIEGKGKGALIECDHTSKEQRVTIDAHLFLRIAICAKKFFRNEPSYCKQIGIDCFSAKRIKRPEWVWNTKPTQRTL